VLVEPFVDGAGPLVEGAVPVEVTVTVATGVGRVVTCASLLAGVAVGATGGGAEGIDTDAVVADGMVAAVDADCGMTEEITAGTGGAAALV